MKKEKQVKAYQRKTKSGKVVTVKAHTAKYDSAEEKAKAVAKKEGAGEEFDRYRATRGLNPFHFRDWYNFNDWDLPKEKWPETVKAADSHIRMALGSTKAYDDYCSKIDKTWKENGYVDYHPVHEVHRTSFTRNSLSIGGNAPAAEQKPQEKQPVKVPRKSKKKSAK